MTHPDGFDDHDRRDPVSEPAMDQDHDHDAPDREEPDSIDPPETTPHRERRSVVAMILAMASKIPLPSLGTERHEMIPGPSPEDHIRPVAEAHAGPNPKPAPRVSLLTMKRETRVGVAALVSFVLLVTALCINKGWVRKPLPLALAKPEGEPAPDKKDESRKPKDDEAKKPKDGEANKPPEPSPTVPRPTVGVEPGSDAPATIPPPRVEDSNHAPVGEKNFPAIPPTIPSPESPAPKLPETTPPANVPVPPPDLMLPPTMAEPAPPPPLEKSPTPEPKPAGTQANPAPSPVELPTIDPTQPPPALEPPPRPSLTPEPTPQASPLQERTTPPAPVESADPSPTEKPAPVAPAPVVSGGPVPTGMPPQLETLPASATAPPIESAATKTSTSGAFTAGWVSIPSGGRRIVGSVPIISTPMEAQVDPSRFADGTRVADGPRIVVDPAAVDQVEPVVHVVRAGENFFTISILYYREGRFYKALHAANKTQVPRIDKLYIGTVLRIPPPEALDRTLIDPPTRSKDNATTATAGRIQVAKRPELAEEADLGMPTKPRTIRPDPETVDTPPAPRRPTYKVKAGENLRTIARDTLGDASRAREIYNLNRDALDDMINVPTGTVLTLPEDANVGRRAPK